VSPLAEDARRRAEAALDGAEKPAAVKALSTGFAETGDPALLGACAASVSLKASSIDFDQSVLMGVHAVLFSRAAEIGVEAARSIHVELLAPAHFSLVARLRKALQPALATPAAEPAPENRVLLVTPQVLGKRHAATWRALELCARLQGEHGRDVLILNTNGWPMHPASTFRPAWTATRPPHQGMIQLDYHGQRIRVFCVPPAPDLLTRTRTAIAATHAFNPAVALSQGAMHPAGDLVSETRPVVYLPTTSLEPIARAHLFVDFAGNYAEPEIDHAGLHGLAPEVRAFRLEFAAREPADAEPITREALGLPEDAFVAAVAGTRLDRELGAPFQAMMAEILARSARVRFLVVGSAPTLADPLKAMSDRLAIAPYTDRLSAHFSLADAYLAPPRIGGGRTAWLAAQAGLPAVYLDFGDVSTALGREHAVADLEALRDAIVAMAEDPGAAAAWRARAEAVRAGIAAREDGMDALLRCMDDAPALFSARTEAAA